MLLNPFIGTSGVGTGGATYFFEERFEGTGYGNSNANGWSETGSTGTVDEDYTTSPLEGAQSLLVSGTAQHPQTKVTLSSDQTELWMFYKFRLDTALSAARRVVTFVDSVGTELCGVQIGTSNQIQPYAAGATGQATDVLTIATNYNFWVHIIKGTGANGSCFIGFSTGTTEVTSGSSFISKVNGVITTDFHEMRCHLTTVASPTTNTTGAFVIDQILISTTGTIGNNPA